uniref:DNA 5'-3' helicase n=1 Tax=Bostrychia simpliciuscula TaxID=324754 RepID=A0A1Z1M8D0_9FLOR|nr:Replication helicase subunit [Bostrychia simpliciuscula]ARW62162.1 Replication helicase subunit [Bostrychia simpliciuscula]
MSNLYKYLLLPQNYIAEELLLGILLIYPNIFENITILLKKEYFFLESHQIIYINILNIYKHKKINVVELIYNLESNKVLYQIGGLDKIVTMMKQSQIFIFSSNINNYIEELIELINNTYIKRLIIQYGHNIIKLAYVSGIAKKNLYNKALSYLHITNIHGNQNEENVIDFKDLISEKLLQIKYSKTYDLIHKKQQIIKSGFLEIDKITSGLPNGDLIIIAGRPSMGKTSFAINIAYNNFYYDKLSICIFSLEMSSKQILNKFISIGSKIPIYEQMTKLSKQQWLNITNICNKLLKNNIYINDKNNISISYIDYIAKQLKKKDHKVQLIIIDYLQLIQLNKENNKIYNRNQELSYITRKLKLLAQFLKLPVIVLSQLNRNIETRNQKQPLLSDLKESGCIHYKNNIQIANLLNNSINLVNLKTICKSYIKTKTISNKKDPIIQLQLKLILKNFKQSIYVSQKYIFQCKIETKVLSLTQNHKYLSQYSWIQTNQILSFTKINNTQQLKRNNIINILFVNKILYSNYSKSYDINIDSYFNFFSKKIILHNSIEQDADIVMILYKNTEKNIEIKNKKVLDITICKNRNGPTGLCEILFVPHITLFETVNNQQINKTGLTKQQYSIS